MTRRLTIGVLAVALIGTAALPRQSVHRELRLTAARGPLVLSSSAEGSAILGARDMRPGSSAAGSVTLTNASAQTARLYLEGSAPDGRAGAGGGSLASALWMRVHDGGGRELLRGDLRELAGCHDLGTIGARERRGYSFSATFPRGGAGDNDYAGATASVDLRFVERPADARDCRAAVAAAPRAPRAVISHRRVALVRGRALIRLICRGRAGQRCTGSVTLERSAGRRRPAGAGVYGRASFSIAAGRAALVRVRAPVRRRKAIATAVVKAGGTWVERRITLIRRPRGCRRCA